MSTRANVIIKDKCHKLYFYRHSDGYPDGALPTLKLFLDWLQTGKIRNNVGQAAGWLVLIGAMEYKTLPPEAFKSESPPEVNYNIDYEIRGFPKLDSFIGWKCGAYEPTTGIHGDIEYLYEIDLEKIHIKVYIPNVDWDTGEIKSKKLIQTIKSEEKHKQSN